MGRDPALTEKHPSVIINGRQYHYGRDRTYGEYLVENAHYAKDCWAFKEKEDLQAFLINLPESADRNLRLRLHPDWQDVTPEQRDAYFEQDKLLFRAMAAEKLKDGNAQSFNMDLEGEHGPHEPQRIESRSTEPAIDRVERQLRDWKTYHSWEGGLSEAGKLRVLEGELDWTGVNVQEKEAVLAREVDFTKITRDQLEFVYEDILFDRLFDRDEEVDQTAARRLFDKATAELKTAGRLKEQPPTARDTTRNFVESIWLDVWPRSGAIVDFGLKSQEHYEALYYPVREGEITPEQLDAALGKGEKLTALARSARSNPHKEITFRTDWDDLLPEPEPESGSSGQARTRPSPSAIANGARSGAERTPSPGGIAEGQDGPESPAPESGRGR